HAAYYAASRRGPTPPEWEANHPRKAPTALASPRPEFPNGILPGRSVVLATAVATTPPPAAPPALSDVVRNERNEAVAIDVVSLVIGKLTQRLAEIPAGTAMELWGPLGNGFLPQPTDHLVMVAGGIGQTPFLALGAEYLHART